MSLTYPTLKTLLFLILCVSKPLIETRSIRENLMPIEELLIRLAGPVAILISVVVSGKYVLRQMKMNYSLNLRNKALGYSLYANEHLRDARIIIEREFGPLFSIKEPIPMAEINRKMEDQEEARASESSRQILPSIMTLLAHWENMALAIHSNIADEDVCFEMVASTLNQHVKVFSNFIVDRRARNQRIYYHLLELNRRWDDWLINVRISKFQPVFGQ
jgi:hypothetical protein